MPGGHYFFRKEIRLKRIANGINGSHGTNGSEGVRKMHWLIVTVLITLVAGAVQLDLTWFQTKDDLRKWMEVYRGHRNS